MNAYMTNPNSLADSRLFVARDDDPLYVNVRAGRLGRWQRVSYEEATHQVITSTQNVAKINKGLG